MPRPEPLKSGRGDTQGCGLPDASLPRLPHRLLSTLYQCPHGNSSPRAGLTTKGGPRRVAPGRTRPSPAHFRAILTIGLPSLTRQTLVRGIASHPRARASSPTADVRHVNTTIGRNAQDLILLRLYSYGTILKIMEVNRAVMQPTGKSVSFRIATKRIQRIQAQGIRGGA